ncbi:MAG: SdrD B-like domain-containing protein [bacterium]|nr:SdrD B-like domain-containing protein [bacterium]
MSFQKSLRINLVFLLLFLIMPISQVVACGIHSLSGQVFEDIDGQGDAFEAGDQGKNNVTVKLLNSSGTVLATTTTNANGNYTFSQLENGTYYVVVNSKEISPKAGYNSSYVLSNVWAEQTYQSDVEATGSKFGGQNPAISDDFTNGNYQHKAKAIINGNSLTSINFGFNFEVIVNINDSNQGSLRQFIKNGNALVGANTSIFKISGTINITTDESGQGILPTVVDDNLTIDASNQWGKGPYADGPGIKVVGPNTFYDELIYIIGADNIILRGIHWKSSGNNQDDVIAFKDSSNNIVGGDPDTQPHYINYITGGSKGAEGIECINFDNSTIIGNYIGVLPDGTVDGNDVAGIGLVDGSCNNLIKRNIIAYNGYGANHGSGIYIGRYQSESINDKNTISQNSIYSNTGSNGLGIDLLLNLSNNYGVTLNDGAYDNSYGNKAMDFPVITKATLKNNTLHLEGYIGSAPNQTLFGNSTVEIFISDNDASGYGEGKTYLGTFTADANANFNTDITIANLKVGDKVTSTATDKDGNTSEFSGNVTVTQGNNPPEPFSLISPTNNSTVATLKPTFDWEDAIDKDGDTVTYTLWYDLKSDFSTKTEVPNLPNSTYTPTTSLQEDTTYYWKVKAVDSKGAITWSKELDWKFKTPKPNVPPTITIIEPKDKVIICTGEFTIEWTDEDPDDNADINLYWDKDTNIGNNTESTKGKEWGVIATGLKEDPDGCADKYKYNASKVPVWCPWERYFYILATISDGVNNPNHDYNKSSINAVNNILKQEVESSKMYSYSGRITVFTKATTGGEAVSTKGAKIVISPGTFSKDVILTVDASPENISITAANMKLIRNSSLCQSPALKATTHKFIARAWSGEFLSIKSSEETESIDSYIASVSNAKYFKITLPYNKEVKEQLRTKENNLYIFYLNEGEGKWEVVKNNRYVDEKNMRVSVDVDKFGIYTIIEKYSQGIDIGHYPTPAKYPNDTKIIFVNILNGKEIKIYNKVGELVRTIKERSHEITGATGERVWDMKNDSGNIVASDVYFYIAEKVDGGKHIGKMMVIK